MLRAAIELLPPNIIEEIDRRLVDGGFRDYQSLSDWLESQGYTIGRSQISRHAQKIKTELLEARRNAMIHAELLKQTGDDDRGYLIAAAGDIGIMKAMEGMLALDPVEDSKALADLMRGTSALGKMSLEQKKWNLISADELERRLKQIETDELSKDKPSTPEELIAQIRQTVLGFSSLETTKVIDVEPNQESN